MSDDEKRTEEEKRIRAIVREESRESVKEVLGEFLAEIRPADGGTGNGDNGEGKPEPDMFDRLVHFLST